MSYTVRMRFPLGASRRLDESTREKRFARRRAVGLRARLREPSSTKVDVDIVDLSTSGFRAETSYGLPPRGVVWLTLPGLAALEALVVWRDRYQYGCAFKHPLHPAVLDHIVAKNWA